MTFKVPSKINPGCKIPDLPEIPRIEDFLGNLPTLALQRLIPVPEVTKLLELAETIQEEIEAYQKMVNRRIRTLRRLTEIPCPLPPVPDTGIDFDLPGVHDLLQDDNNQTLGESVLIEEGEEF